MWTPEKEYALYDALAIILGGIGSLFVAFGFTSSGAYVGTPEHYVVMVRSRWLLDWGVRLIAVSFVLQLPKVWRTLKDILRGHGHRRRIR